MKYSTKPCAARELTAIVVFGLITGSASIAGCSSDTVTTDPSATPNKRTARVAELKNDKKGKFTAKKPAPKPAP